MFKWDLRYWMNYFAFIFFIVISVWFNVRKIYNIVDDDPAPRVEVFTFAQNLVKSKWPEHEQLLINLQMADSLIPEGGYSEEKRVSNNRMKEELGVKLLHPTYRSGLQDIIRRIDSPSEHNPPSSWDSVVNCSRFRGSKLMVLALSTPRIPRALIVGATRVAFNKKMLYPNRLT